MFSKAIKIVTIGSVLLSSSAFADADDWDGYDRYVQGYGYAPVVQEEFLVTPRGVVEEETVYVPERVVEYQPVQPRYYAPPPPAGYYGYAQQMPMSGYRDWDD